MTAATLTAQRVREALARVMDPEIPACSITDLGMIERVTVTDEALEVELLPTFVGCPATEMIRAEVDAELRQLAGDRAVRVRFVWDPPWTTDRITPAGREALRGFGIAPAEKPRTARPSLPRVAPPCPYCGSRDTVVESDFGPTPCRTVHFCRACRNPFEGFKLKEA